MFDKVGVDYAGPVYTKVGSIRKPYVAVFVSLSVKAVHLEAVCDLTTDAFVACLRRFVAHRGRYDLLSPTSAVTTRLLFSCFCLISLTSVLTVSTHFCIFSIGFSLKRNSKQSMMVITKFELVYWLRCVYICIYVYVRMYVHSYPKDIHAVIFSTSSYFT